MACLTSIAAGITVDCTKIPAKGVVATLYLANKADVASYTEGAVPTIVTAITMAGSTVFYAFEGVKISVKPRWTARATDYGAEFIHEIDSVSFKKDGASKAVLEKIATGQVVAVIQNNFTGTAGETKYEVYGLDAGLFMSEMGEDKYGEVPGITYKLRTLDITPEQHMPRSLFITDLATTDALVAALLV